jgi:hypothetical protein
MINPLRRLFYEMFVLPVLRPIQKLIDAGARIGSRGRLARRARSQSAQWTHQDVLSRRARHLAMLFAISLVAPATVGHGQQTPPYFPNGSSQASTIAGPQFTTYAVRHESAGTYQAHDC